jgi:hypothetical protein
MENQVIREETERQKPMEEFDDLNLRHESMLPSNVAGSCPSAERRRVNDIELNITSRASLLLEIPPRNQSSTSEIRENSFQSFKINDSND